MGTRPRPPASAGPSRDERRAVIVDTTSDSAWADLTIEDYPDLLACRALSEWRFTGERTVRTRPELLAAAGLAGAIETVSLGEPSPFLFDYQQWIIKLAIDRQRFAVFANTGFGKTVIQLDWARSALLWRRTETLLFRDGMPVPVGARAGDGEPGRAVRPRGGGRTLTLDGLPG